MHLWKPEFNIYLQFFLLRYNLHIMTCTSLKYVFADCWQMHDHHTSASFHRQQITLPPPLLRKYKPWDRPSLSLQMYVQSYYPSFLFFCYHGQHAPSPTGGQFLPLAFTSYPLQPFQMPCSIGLSLSSWTHISRNELLLRLTNAGFSLLPQSPHTHHFLFLETLPTSCIIILTHPSGLCLNAIYLDVTSLTVSPTAW